MCDTHTHTKGKTCVLKSKQKTVQVAQSCPTLCNPMDFSMEFSRPKHWSMQPFPSPGDLPNPGIEPRSPTLQVDALPAESQGKPKNTGVGRLSLLQQIFPTQESKRGFLHCRQILYQLSYQGSLSRLKSHTIIVGALSPFRSIFVVVVQYIYVLQC